MTDFREIQPLRRNPAIWLMAFASVLLVLVPLSLPEVREQLTVSFALLLLAPIAGLLWLFNLHLETEVREEGLCIWFRGAWLARTYRWIDIGRAEPTDYRPDWRGRRRRERAWIIWGKQAVRLHLRDGDTVLVGSTKPEQLAAAIRERLGSKTAGSQRYL